jgi:hypothetical protein
MLLSAFFFEGRRGGFGRAVRCSVVAAMIFCKCSGRFVQMKGEQEQARPEERAVNVLKISNLNAPASIRQLIHYRFKTLLISGRARAAVDILAEAHERAPKPTNAHS